MRKNGVGLFIWTTVATRLVALFLSVHSTAALS